jgi:hypothetical protein
MRKLKILLGAPLLCCLAVGSASAATRIVKTEPPMGKMKQGERVLVDDGSCGPGRIKEVTGGNHWKVGGHPGSNVERTRRCIAR